MKGASDAGSGGGGGARGGGVAGGGMSEAVEDGDEGTSRSGDTTSMVW
jgi:hypothetical protein